MLKENDIGPHSGWPESSYGWAKLTLERLVEWHDLRALVLRPFSGYGADQGTDYPFGAILARAQAREDPLTVWSDTCRDCAECTWTTSCGARWSCPGSG